MLSIIKLKIPQSSAQVGGSTASHTNHTCSSLNGVCGLKPRNIASWVLVSEPGFFRFWPISLEIYFFTRNETQEQHSLLDTIFDYIFYFGPPGKYLLKTPKRTTCRPASRSRFSSLFINIFLEIQNKRYSQIVKYYI